MPSWMNLIKFFVFNFISGFTLMLSCVFFWVWFSPYIGRDPRSRGRSRATDQATHYNTISNHI